MIQFASAIPLRSRSHFHVSLRRSPSTFEHIAGTLASSALARRHSRACQPVRYLPRLSALNPFLFPFSLAPFQRWEFFFYGLSRGCNFYFRSRSNAFRRRAGRVSEAEVMVRARGLTSTPEDRYAATRTRKLSRIYTRGPDTLKPLGEKRLGNNGAHVDDAGSSLICAATIKIKARRDR